MKSNWIMTIGYGGKKPTDFFNELSALEPDIVVDVREDPFHAFLGAYTFPQLQTRLKDKYISVRELGNKNRSLPPTLVDEENGMRKLISLACDHNRIVLLCSEQSEDRCHRSYIKEKLLENLKLIKP
jgi:uncharacterized protein (DUF488 family)